MSENNILETIKDRIVDHKGNKCHMPENVEYVGLYFSAHWCPPCRGFTPVLSDYYKEWVVVDKDVKISEGKRNYEIVFISSDRDQASFKEYFDTMPWKAIEFGSDLRQTLKKKYNISGIPTLVIVNKKGDTVTSNGRAVVSKNEPWENSDPSVKS